MNDDAGSRSCAADRACVCFLVAVTGRGMKKSMHFLPSIEALFRSRFPTEVTSNDLTAEDGSLVVV
jgi:hypothetical protein